MKTFYTQLKSVFALFASGMLGSIISVAQTINVNTSISTDTVFQDDVFVSGGATLTINSATAEFRGNLQVDGASTLKFEHATIRMDDDKEIRINHGVMATAPGGALLPTEGGYLISNSSIITSVHSGQYWKGIRGYAASNFLNILGAPGAGGRIEINGGTISNAYIGIKNITVGGTDAAPGPIPTKIFAEGVTFTDNLLSAVELSGYTTYQSAPFNGTVIDLNHVHYDTVLASDASFVSCVFKYTTGSDFIPQAALVRLNQCNFMPFIGCTFQGVPGNSLVIPPGSSIGRGIYAVNSSVVVRKNILNGDIPLFENLYLGIQVVGRGIANEVRSVIRDGNFYCQNGIFLQRGYNDLIVNNRFYKSNFNFESADHIGLFIMDSRRFRVEANVFDYAMSYTDTGYVGIVVYECGPDNNEIYRNQFKRVNYGIQSVGQNRNFLGSTGLKFLCNNFVLGAENVLNRYDISVMKDPKLPALNPPTQGVHHRQGNDLSLNTLYDMRSAGNRFNQMPNPLPGTARHFYAENGTYIFPGIKYWYYQQSPNVQLPNYRQGLVLDMASDYHCPPKADGAYTVFNMPVNWTSRLRDLENKIILLSSVEEPILDTLSYLHYKYTNLADSVLAAYIYDVDSLIAVLEQLSYHYPYKVQLATLYVHRGEYARAVGILRNEIPDNFHLEEADRIAISHLADLYEIVEILQRERWTDLSASTKAMVRDYASKSFLFASSMALALLAEYEDYCASPWYVTITASGDSEPLSAIQDGHRADWSLHPNPSSTIIYVNWSGKEARFELWDMTGRKVFSQDLSDYIKTIDVHRVASGIYTAKLTVDGVEMASTRFVKQ